MKVLIADALPDSALAQMRAVGFDVTADANLTPDTLPAAIRGFDVLVVRSTKVTAAAIDAAECLRLVIRAGAGTSNIDVKRASESGVFVANCPGKNADAVAELTLGLLIALDRRITEADSALKSGTWNKREFSKARGLKGRTLGVIGMGAIGSQVARRAQALGMNVVGWSRTFDADGAAALGVTCARSLEALAGVADAISIHVPLTETTRGLIDAEFLAQLRDDTFVVNAARGGVVDEAAMREAVESGRVRYATDVFDDEPASSNAAFDHPLACNPRVISTPHIGASTGQAQDAVANEALRVLLEFRKSGVVHNCINVCEPQGNWQLTVRHLNKVGVLATVLGLLRDAYINVEQLENIIFDGEVAACAQIQLSGEPSDEVIAAVRGCAEVIGLSLRAM